MVGEETWASSLRLPALISGATSIVSCLPECLAEKEGACRKGMDLLCISQDV